MLQSMSSMPPLRIVWRQRPGRRGKHQAPRRILHGFLCYCLSTKSPKRSPSTPSTKQTRQLDRRSEAGRPQPASLFPSIVTLKSVTKSELILIVKTLLACKSYGAESRTGGDCRNSIFAVAAGWEEIITPLELTLELYDKKDQLTAESLRGLLEDNTSRWRETPKKSRCSIPREWTPW